MCIASGNLPRSFSFFLKPQRGGMFIDGRHVLATQAPAGRQVNREARKLEREQAKLDA